MLLEIETDKVILEILSVKKGILKNFCKKDSIIKKHQFIGSLKHINKVIKKISNFLNHLTFDTFSTYTRRIISKKI